MTMSGRLMGHHIQINPFAVFISQMLAYNISSPVVMNHEPCIVCATPAPLPFEAEFSLSLRLASRPLSSGHHQPVYASNCRHPPFALVFTLPSLAPHPLP